jgi:hypothetical protein
MVTRGFFPRVERVLGGDSFPPINNSVWDAGMTRGFGGSGEVFFTTIYIGAKNRRNRNGGK